MSIDSVTAQLNALNSEIETTEQTLSVLADNLRRATDAYIESPSYYRSRKLFSNALAYQEQNSKLNELMERKSSLSQK